MKPRTIAISVGAAIVASLSHLAAADVYIPLGSANSAVIIDENRDIVVGRIGGLPNAHGLAGTPDGRLLIAGSYTERPAGGPAPKKPKAMAGGEHAAHHAAPPTAAPGPTPMVSTLSVIRISDRAIVRRIDVPGAVHHVTVSPDGRFAAATHPATGAISVIDLTSFAVIATVPTGPSPNYAVFSPDNRRLYVSNAGNDTVSFIDTGRWIVRRNVATGTSPEHVVLSRDGQTLFVNNVADGTVSVIATPAAKVIRTLTIGAGLHGIDLSDDGKTLFVAARGDEALAAVDLESGNIRKIRLAPAPYHVAVLPGTGKLYVSSAGDPKLWVVDAKSFTRLGQIAIGGKGHQMAFTGR